MTKTGQNLINEFRNEQNSALSEQKVQILTNQVSSTFISLWKIVILAIYCFFATTLVVFTGAIAIIDAELLNHFRQSSDEELVKSIQILFSLIFMLAVTGMVFFAVIKGPSYFFHEKSEVIKDHEKEAKLLEKMIEINEELLYRHKLISKKGVSHD